MCVRLFLVKVALREMSYGVEAHRYVGDVCRKQTEVVLAVLDS